MNDDRLIQGMAGNGDFRILAAQTERQMTAPMTLVTSWTSGMMP